MRPIAVIPVYNQPGELLETAKRCEAFSLPVLMVDDGSDAATKNALSETAAACRRVSVITRKVNGGKGSAVIDGFRAAAAAGFTHVFQLDADGQHDLDCIPGFLDAARRNPHALVCGWPVYDSTVPKARLLGHRFSNFWIAVNTLSFAIRDGMIGFRVYPLAETLAMLGKDRIGRRMDFDIEIAVHLYWSGVSIVNLPVGVTYPQGGVSHFGAADNAVIAKMHARSFFGMLKRFPMLLKRRRERLR